MPAEELACVVERLQLAECLKIANAQFCHFCYRFCGGLCLQQFVELLHFAPCVDAVIINDCRHLHIDIIKILPVYFGVFFFFFFEEVFFFSGGVGTLQSFPSSVVFLPEGV